MARRCEFSGKQVVTGHKVSHSNIKTLRTFRPNLNIVKLTSEALGRGFTFKISSHALRTVDHRGGLDAFLLKEKDGNLSENALRVKKDILRAQKEASAA
jgi:large subunit ribosomal protein L28